MSQYWEHTKQTGSVMPSSVFLGRALASELAKPRGPARILEVGPGTGSVTKQIVRRLQPDDHFDCVELNDRFVAWLRQRFENEPLFVEHRRQINLIHGPVESLTGVDHYDFIVSGLPLNSFPVSQVREIFRVFRRLLKPGGSLSYFEYIAIRDLQMPFIGRKKRHKLAHIGRIVGHYIRKCQYRRQQIWCNVTPAFVRHLMLKPMPRPDLMP